MTNFKVFKFNPQKDKAHTFHVFEVPNEKGMTVLEGLFYIFENLDNTLAFRSSCRAAVCGSCAMHINGKYRLACNTLIESLKSSTIIIQPLAHLPIFKDLVVDMSTFFKHYQEIKPYLIPDKTIPQKEFIQKPKDRKKIDGMVDCILCAACYGSCPVTSGSPNYLGPHALLKAARFIYDSRDAGNKERLNLISHDKGLFRCHTIFNCQIACPKDIDPSGAIAKLKMKSVWSTIRKFFSR